MADFPNIEFYAVSCAAQKDMCKQYEVTSYPTFYIFNDENPRGKLFNKGAGGVTEEAIIAALAKAKQDTAEERGLAAKEDDSADDDDDSQDGMLEHKEDDDPVMDDDEQAAKQGGNGATNTNGGAETAAKNELPPAVVRTSERDGAANDSKGDSDEDDDDDYGGRVKQSRFESPQLSSSKEMDVRQARIQRLRERVAARREALKGQVSPGQSGALSAKYERHDMDRFKDQVREEREKPRNRLRTERGPSRGREMEPIAEGATKTMRENVPGTKEHEQRKQEILDSIRRTKGQSRAKQVEEKLATPPPPDGKASLPFKKEVSKPRLVERVPVMKRLATLGSEEELILDTTLSFLQGLKIGVFRTNQALKDHEKNALEDWLYLLRVTLPQEWSIHEVIDDLLDNFDSIVQSDENLARILAKHPFPRSAWSESCGQGKVGGGFTCGMWKLIHTMTVGLAEYRGGMNVIKAGMARSDSSYFSPEEAGDVLREYVANFLPCTDCAKHFTEKYDDCSYRRCHRLHDNAETASDADWKELAKYMWEFHNEVSIRILHEQADAARKQISGEIGPGAASRADEIRVIFPSLAQCVTCFKSDGSWNEDALFLFLERTYWSVDRVF